MIKFNDLYKQNKVLEKEYFLKFKKKYRNSEFILSKSVDTFEKNFKKMLGAKNCISCNSGTDALFFALKSLNLKKKNHIITTAHSWVSTSYAISNCGYKPIFCDVEKDTFNIDPDEISKKITSKTGAILIVHMYGLACKIDEIKKIAKEKKLFLIEDCAQCHFGKYKGKHVGLFGDLSAYSFYPGKNLGGIGDGGAVISNNNKFTKRIKMLSRNGGLKKNHHQIIGYNSRLDSINAEFLNIKLRYIIKWNKKRKKIAERYNSKLKGLKNKIKLPIIPKNADHTFHLFVIKARNRNKLKKYLKQKKIETFIHYPSILPKIIPYKILL